jgi:hypothetical protein
MQTLKLHCFYGLIIAGLVSALFYPSPDSDKSGSAAPIRNLHELATYLRHSGLDFRAVPQRGDGLWLDALYLTQTQEDAEGLKRLVIQPRNMANWAGTVIVFEEGTIQRRDTSDWGDNGWQWRTFLFYGDKEILRWIIRALDK